MSVNDEIYNSYLRKLGSAARNSSLRTALERAIESYRRNRDEAFKLYPYVEKKASKLRKIKKNSLLRIEELIKQTRDVVEELKGNFYMAENAYKALEYVKSVVKGAETVVKSKSLTMEELNINSELERIGCKVFETDLGEFIIQQLKSKPMHLLSPAIHIPREKVAKLLSKITGKKLPAEIPVLVKEVRNYLRQKFVEADVGLTGANAVVAETGSVFIIENEGNARLVSGLPEKHIVVAGIEKVIPTLSDAMLLVEVVTRYANYKAPTYVSIVSGPSKTGDIEKKIVYGAHGPKEFHLVLLDNGRKEMAKDPVYRQALYCLRCGGCLYECPVYSLVSGYFGHVYMGGIGAILTRFLLGGLEKAAPLAYTCTLCGRCKKYCPMEIDVPEMMLKLREEIVGKGMVPFKLKENLKNATGVNTD